MIRACQGLSSSASTLGVRIPATVGGVVSPRLCYPDDLGPHGRRVGIDGRYRDRGDTAT